MTHTGLERIQIDRYGAFNSSMRKNNQNAATFSEIQKCQM